MQKDQEITMLIQVTSSLKDEKTKKRELQSFSKTKKELKIEKVLISVVITEDNSGETIYDDTEIKIINLKEWLLEL